jgi:hypothetical protein
MPPASQEQWKKTYAESSRKGLKNYCSFERNLLFHRIFRNLAPKTCRFNFVVVGLDNGFQSNFLPHQFVIQEEMEIRAL